MNDCYLIDTGSYLPGPPVSIEHMQDFLGDLKGEADVRKNVLKMNGIQLRHYAQDTQQNATESVYSMARKSVHACSHSVSMTPSFLAAGSTYAPLSGPGIATQLHAELAAHGPGWNRSVEVASQAGICSAGASALVAAIRAIKCGEHQQAVAVGAEHASQILKSSVIRPLDDREQYRGNLRRSRWFMSVFLRSMLSDGAGAAVLADRPSDERLNEGCCFKVDWVHSRSYAHDTELCMKLETSNALLSQDVSVLSRYLFPRTETFLQEAFATNAATIDDYDVALPHLSSFFFRRRMEKIMTAMSPTGRCIPYWTNLATAGNTGAASILIMLDEFRRTQEIHPGQRFLLFVPESGRFHFTLVSLTAMSQ